MILKNNTSSHVGRFACLLILGIGVTVLPFSVQARPKNDSSSDLEKRITRLEKVIDNLRKALGRDAAVEAGLSSKPRQAPLIHKERPLPALGQDKKTREEMLNAIKRLDQQQRAAGGGPKLETRLKVYEMAFRRQAAVTELQKKATQLKAELRSIEQQIKKWQKSASDNNTLFLPLKRK